MNWDALGAIAELVGAIAVVASLLYLAVQVRAEVLQHQKCRPNSSRRACSTTLSIH